MIRPLLCWIQQKETLTWVVNEWQICKSLTTPPQSYTIPTHPAPKCVDCFWLSTLSQFVWSYILGAIKQYQGNFPNIYIPLERQWVVILSITNPTKINASKQTHFLQITKIKHMEVLSFNNAFGLKTKKSCLDKDCEAYILVQFWNKDNCHLALEHKAQT